MPSKSHRKHKKKSHRKRRRRRSNHQYSSDEDRENRFRSRSPHEESFKENDHRRRSPLKNKNCDDKKNRRDSSRNREELNNGEYKSSNKTKSWYLYADITEGLCDYFDKVSTLNNVETEDQNDNNFGASAVVTERNCLEVNENILDISLNENASIKHPEEENVLFDANFVTTNNIVPFQYNDISVIENYVDNNIASTVDFSQLEVSVAEYGREETYYTIDDTLDNTEDNAEENYVENHSFITEELLQSTPEHNVPPSNLQDEVIPKCFTEENLSFNEENIFENSAQSNTEEEYRSVTPLRISLKQINSFVKTEDELTEDLEDEDETVVYVIPEENSVENFSSSSENSWEDRFQSNPKKSNFSPLRRSLRVKNTKNFAESEDEFTPKKPKIGRPKKVHKTVSKSERIEKVITPPTTSETSSNTQDSNTFAILDTPTETTNSENLSNSQASDFKTQPDIRLSPQMLPKKQFLKRWKERLPEGPFENPFLNQELQSYMISSPEKQYMETSANTLEETKKYIRNLERTQILPELLATVSDTEFETISLFIEHVNRRLATPGATIAWDFFLRYIKADTKIKSE